MIIRYIKDEDGEGKILMIMNSKTARGGFKG